MRSTAFVLLLLGVLVPRAARVAAQATINDPPVPPHLITVFPARDFVSTEGFEPSDGPFTFEVIRRGVIVGTASGQMPDNTGLMEVNHPGGGCWEVVTPSISPGDIIRITDAHGNADQTTTANVTVDRPIQTSGSTMEVHGTAQTAAGTPIPIAQLEQRMIAGNPGFSNGKRRLSAPGDGVITYDPVGPDNPLGIKWTARYTLNATDLALALGVEARVMWLGRDGVGLSELTIFENDPGVVVKGPQAPCTAPSGVAPLSLSASPKGGVFNAAQLVTLKPSNPAAAVFYTTDGSDPADPANAARQTYTTPVSLFAADGTTLALRAVAVLTDPTGTAPPETSNALFENYRFDTVVPTVAASPAGGAFKATQIVTLTASEPSTIFYTTNNTDPGVASNGTRVTYAGPLTLSVATTLKFVARDAAGNQSATRTEAYTIDNVAPPLPDVPDLEPFSDSGTSSTDNLTNDRLPVFTGGAEVGATLRLIVDGVVNGTSIVPDTGLYITGVANALADGPHTVRAQAVDAAGNASAATAALSITVDTTAPVVTITSKPPNPSTSAAPQFAFSSPEAGVPFSCSFSTGADAFSACASPKAYSAQPDGDYTFKVRALDAAGNAGLATSALTIDTAAPTVTAAPAGGTYARAQSVTLTSTKPGTIRFTTDGSTPTATSSAYAGPIAISASTTLKFFATDAAGTASPVVTETYVIDTTAPTVNASPKGGVYNKPQSVTLTSAEPGVIHYTTDGTVPTLASPVYTAPIPISTATTLQFFAVDAVGNQSAAASESYTFDTAAPTVSAAPAGGLFNATQTVTLTMSEPGSIFFTRDGTAPTAASTKYTAPISIAATTTLKFIAVDQATNASPVVTETYTIDTVAPTVTATPKGTPFNAPLLVTLTSSKPGAIFFTLDGTTPTTTSSQYASPISVTATTTLKFIARDNVGNQSAVGSEVYTLDQTAPTVTAAPRGGSYNAPQSVTLTASEAGASIFFTRDGTDPTPASSRYTTPISIAASGALKFMAVDAAGNASAVVTENYVIDTVLPVVTASPRGGLYSSAQNVTLTSSKGGTIFFTLDGTTPTRTSPTYSGPINVASTATLKFFAVDAVGNASPVATETYTIDLVAPVVTAAPRGGTFTTAQSVALSANEAGSAIFYTLDGSTPTAATGTRYATPIGIAATRTLKFIGVDPAGNTSTVATEVYTIAAADTTPPTVTASPAGGTFTAPVSVTLTANEPATIRYTTNGTAPTATSTVYTGPIGIAATTTLRYFATDTAGNASVAASQTYTITVTPPPAGLPAPWVTADIGAVGLAGSAAFATGTFTVKGAGADIWGTADAFRYVYQPLNGNGQIVARVATVQNTNAWVKAGVMIRATTAAGSQHALMIVTPAKGNNFQRRVTAGGTSTNTAGAVVTAPYWVKLTRSGSTITAFESANGTTWTTVGTATITMPASVLVGLVVSSHSATTLAQATFDQVSVGPLPAGDTTPPTVAASPVGGTFTAPVSVTLTASEPSTIRYTTNGTAPTATSTVYTGPIGIAATTTLRYVATDSAGNQSAIGSQVYTITAGTDTTPPTVTASPAGGTFTAPVSVTLTASEPSTIRYTTNGTAPTATSTVYTGPIGITATTTLRYVATDAAGNQSAAASQTYTINAAPGALPAGWTTADIGAVGLAGAGTFATGTYTLKGAGADIWGTADAFRFVYRTLAGNGQIVARVATVQNTNAWVKAGVMIRADLTPGSPHGMMIVTPSKGNNFQRRLTAGATSSNTAGAVVTAPYWVKLTRSGNTITAFESVNGTTWTTVGSATVTLGTNALVGLVVSSHSTTTLATATFDGVAVQ